MSTELAYRLLIKGLVTPDDLRRALAAHLVQGISLPSALVQLGALARSVLQGELNLAPLPTLQSVRPLPMMVQRLPAGMCRRLLAVPVSVDPMHGAVEVAVVDGFHRHIALEFAYHLRGTVRLVRAPWDAIEDAIRALSLPTAGSNEPIPLVPRLSRHDSLPPSRPYPPPSSRAPSDPVVRLQRPKPFSTHPPFSPLAPHGPFPDIGAIVASLRRASSRDDIVQGLLEGLRTVARRVGVFSVRKGEFRGWRCNEELGAAGEFRNVSIPMETPSIFATAAAMGFYLGPVPRTSIHEGLLSAMGGNAGEVAVLPVHVGGRIALFLFLEDIGDTLIATRRAEDLARVAGDVLARLLQRSKD